MKKGILILIIITILSFSFYNVKASEISKNKLYYYFTFKNNKGRNFSDTFYMYVYANKSIAYCIEPGVRMGTNYYLSDDTTSLINKERIEDLMFFGYQFDNHYEEEYYMATQVLIWKELLNDKDIIISTEPFGKGSILNIDKYIYEIENTIDNYKYGVSEQLSAKVLLGSNNKLIIEPSLYFNGMKIEYDDMFNIERTDKGIKVSNFDKIGRYSLKYYLGYDHLDKYAIYKSDDGQDLLIRGNLDRLLGDDEINIFGCDLYLSKLDKDTNEKLDGSIYGIYDSNHELIREVPISDKESTYINDLPIGTYYLQELVSPDGYLLDDTIYTIAFDDDNSYYNILLFDEKINNSINEEITMDESLLNDVEEVDDNTYNLIIEDVPNTNKYDYSYLFVLIIGVFIVKKIY